MDSSVKSRLQTCYRVYKLYEHILDSYVSDYYVGNHWTKIPKNWQYLYNIPVVQIEELLDFTKPIKSGTHALSLLCLRNLVINNVISRKKMNISEIDCVFQDEVFMNFFWKNVKMKKRHEINIMANMCYETALKSNCFYVVDIGSGLGHLSRMLSYGYGFKVCTFEANHALSSSAKEMDTKFEKALQSKCLTHKNTFPTNHMNKKIELDLKTEDFFKIVKEGFDTNRDDFTFGIVGLHPCGNLGSTLLRLYSECQNIAFINIASCCYMKLTLKPSLNVGFPLSNFCKYRNFNLTYLSCEIACHAIENYVEKLRKPQDYYKLKIHAYRAALEKILISMDEQFKHIAVGSVKYDESLSFKNYCYRALKKQKIVIADEIITEFEELINRTWRHVVLFYSVRLMLAPLVETIILFDRLLYTEECSSYCDILPVFNCNISPRNHVLSARKKIGINFK